MAATSSGAASSSATPPSAVPAAASATVAAPLPIGAASGPIAGALSAAAPAPSGRAPLLIAAGSPPATCLSVVGAELLRAAGRVRLSLANRGNVPCQVVVSEVSVTGELPRQRLALRSRIDAPREAISLRPGEASRPMDLPFVVPIAGFDCAWWSAGQLRLVSLDTAGDARDPARTELTVDLPCKP
jgi:hypothetical protein